MRSLTLADGTAPAAGTRDQTHISFLFPDDCVAAVAPAAGSARCADAAASAERFRRDLAALVPSPTAARPIGVAVSGGADSLALLLLAHAAFPDAVAAATVDHGLRAGSADEARFVAAICAEIGVPHTILTLAMAPGGSLQARARHERYAALGRWSAGIGAAAVATAHHRDDQAETLLMRVARGAGLAGLASIRPVTRMDYMDYGVSDVLPPAPNCAPAKGTHQSNTLMGPGAGAQTGSPPSRGHNISVVRPLLGWSRAELRDIVAGAGLTPVVDPANDSLLFDRTRARRLLAATPWLDAERLAATAANLAEAEEALAWAADALLGGRIARRADGSLAVAAADLPAELQRRLLAEALRLLDGGAEHPGPKLARLLATLRAGRTATIGAVKAEGGAAWRLSAAPPRQGN